MITTPLNSNPAETFSHQVIAADTLDGKEIVSAQGEHLGKIKHLMLNEQSGQVAYVVMSSGGFLGIGDKQLAIPWPALQRPNEDQPFMLNMTLDQVKNAPSLEDGDYSLLGDPQWSAGAHDFYSVAYPRSSSADLSGTPGSTIGGVPPGTPY